MGTPNEKDTAEQKLRALLATADRGRDSKGKIERDMSCIVCVFIQATRYHRENVSDDFLLEVLTLVEDWRRFFAMINNVLGWDADGWSLLAFARSQVLSVLEARPSLFKRLIKDMRAALLDRYMTPAIPRLAFNLLCPNAEAAGLLFNPPKRGPSARYRESVRLSSPNTRAALLLFLAHDLTDPQTLEPIEAYAVERRDDALLAAVKDARIRLATVSVCRMPE